MFTYSAYGLGIHSDIELAEFTPTEYPVQDVQIRFGSIESVPTGESLFRIDDELASYIVVENTAVFYVEEGNLIVIDPRGNTDLRTIPPFVTGACMGVILWQRGRFLLHASAAIMNGGAVAFVGHKGQGKSVMAASLVQHGYPLLTDDILAYDSTFQIVFPASPQVKLWSDALSYLGKDSDPLPHVHPMTDKRQLKLDTQSAPDATFKLRHVFVLEKGDNCRIVPLTPLEAFAEIMRYSYAARWLSATAPNFPHFGQVSDFVNSVPVSRLIRPKQYSAIPDVIALLEEMFVNS
jgi:hypothetical protein